MNKNDYIKFIAIIVLTLLLMITINTCVKTKKELRNISMENFQNSNAKVDSLRKEINKKDGTISYIKLQYESDIEMLKKNNKDLANEVSYLKGKLTSVTSTTVYITIHDTIWLHNNVSEEDGYLVIRSILDTVYNKTSGRYLKIKTIFDKNVFNTRNVKTILEKDSIYMTFITGTRINNKGLKEFFVKSNYPGFDIKDIASYELDTKPTVSKNFIIGPYVGLGISNAFVPSLQLGFGLTYKIFSF